MHRPEMLALPVAALSAIVIPLRSLHAFDPVRDAVDIDLLALGIVSRVAWSVLAIGGLALVGYAYGRRATEPPVRVFVVSAVAAFVGVLAGFLFLRLAGDAVRPGSLASEALTLGGYAVLDALMLGLLALGGYALAFDVPSTRAT